VLLEEQRLLQEGLGIGHAKSFSRFAKEVLSATALVSREHRRFGNAKNLDRPRPVRGDPFER
jgi:hypothetical protein